MRAGVQRDRDRLVDARLDERGWRGREEVSELAAVARGVVLVHDQHLHLLRIRVTGEGLEARAEVVHENHLVLPGSSDDLGKI